MDPSGQPIERRIEAAGVDTAVLERSGSGTPVVLWHGVPNSYAMWKPFRRHIEGPFLSPDMPGFGRSERPDPTGFDGTVEALADWAEALIDALGLERYSLVAHDWGSIGLLAAARHPERIERVVALNGVPYEYDYRWHWIARTWRRRGLGEAFNGGATLAPVTSAILRQARPGWRAMPKDFIADVIGDWDRGKSRAILSLYRSADPERLGRLGDALRRITSPALVLWGGADPYIPSAFAARWAARLGSAELELFDDAGHWPWIDRPDLIARAGRFLAAG